MRHSFRRPWTLWKRFSLGKCEENGWPTLLFLFFFSSWQRKGRIRWKWSDLEGLKSSFQFLGNLDPPLVGIIIFIAAAPSRPSVRSNCNLQNYKSDEIISSTCSFSYEKFGPVYRVCPNFVNSATWNLLVGTCDPSTKHSLSLAYVECSANVVWIMTECVVWEVRNWGSLPPFPPLRKLILNFE